MSMPRLNRRLVLEAPVTVPDGAGGFALTWQTLGTLWAEVRPGTGREAAGVEVNLAQVAQVITVRGAPVGNARRPEPGQRLTEGSRHFAILAVTEADPEGRHLKCFAHEEQLA